MKRILALAGLGAAIAALGVSAAVALAEGNGPDPKVFVCKYVGTPGVDERLQTGDNPISVSANSIKEWNGQVPGNLIGLAFADKQGKSIVIAIDTGQPEPGVSACPQPQQPEKGQLIVEKVVVNDDGGTKTASDFSFTVNGQQHAFEADGSNSVVLDPGAYTVAEVAAAGYTSSIDDGSVTVEVGKTTTVTITNDDVKGEEPTDVCPNIPGNQKEIPAGMVKDAQGDCVTPKPHEVTGGASVSCILPDGYYRVSGTVDGHAADKVEPATLPGDTKGSTEVTVTRGDTSVKTTVSTDGDCGAAPTPPEVTPPVVTTAPVETVPTAPTTTTEPTAPLTPPTTTTKKPTTKKPAVTKTSPAPPKKAVAGAFAKEPPKLAYTP